MTETSGMPDGAVPADVVDVVDVVVVGAGPAGLAAARELARAGLRRVVVLDREPAPGGVPRHCHHTGFGWFDQRRVLSGPAYAERVADRARAAGAEILVETTAIAWNGPTTLTVTGPGGVRSYAARAVLLATGCRERPRAARLVAGTRPAGVLTTGALQQLVHQRRWNPGRRAVIVGAEHVSWSAVLTLTDAGASIAAMVTDLPRHQTVPLVAWLLALRHDFPLHASARVTDIAGRRRVEGVTVVTERSGAGTTFVPCDTVVFTGDWIPDHELARAGGVTIDPRTRGPLVDAALRTSVRGVFAAGNLLRGAEMADVAALEGRAAATSMLAWLGGAAWPRTLATVIGVAAPLAWITPGAVRPGDPPPPRALFTLRTTEFLSRGLLEVRQGDRLLHAERCPPLVPNRAVTLSARWTDAVRPAEGPAVVLYR